MGTWIVPVLLAVPASSALASPYVAYVGDVSVHSPSPNAKIMVVDLATGEATNAGEGLFSARQPAWSPDAALLAFEAVENERNDIFVCSPDGSGRRNVTQTPDVWESAPGFITRSLLAYLEGPDRTQVVVRNLETDETRLLTTETQFHSRPVAGPGGKLVAVFGAQELAGPGHISVIDVDTGTARRLTTEEAVYSEPCFSPDGELVAFAFDGCDIGGATRGLAMMPTEGGEATLLASDGYPPYPVSFSPDGSTITYTGASTYHSTWVKTVTIDGGEPTRLDTGRFHICGWPSFGPDGRSVAYQGVYAAKYSVHVLDLETGEARRLTPEGETGVTPAFSPN